MLSARLRSTLCWSCSCRWDSRQCRTRILTTEALFDQVRSDHGKERTESQDRGEGIFL